MIHPYIAPFIAYLVGSTVVGALGIEIYPVTYPIMVVLVGVGTWILLRGKRIIVPHWRIVDAVFVGLIGIVIWIALCELHLEAKLAQFLPGWLRPGSRVSYNPFEELSVAWQAYVFIVFRMIGLSLLVPVVEEVFWRGFLSRWIIAEEWEELPLGTFSWSAFWGVVGLFTLAHPEWFAAASYAILMSGFFYWKKDLWSCIVAHGVSNFAMGMYVLTTKTWWLW